MDQQYLPSCHPPLAKTVILYRSCSSNCGLGLFNDVGGFRRFLSRVVITRLNAVSHHFMGFRSTASFVRSHCGCQLSHLARLFVPSGPARWRIGGFAPFVIVERVAKVTLDCICFRDSAILFSTGWCCLFGSSFCRCRP
jgi:hypothetical protein